MRQSRLARHRAGAGFTLIELLVVIAIIAVLAAILFPVFSHARERARTASCLNNLKQLGLAFRQYAEDNGGWFPRSQAWGLTDWAGCPGTGRPFTKADVEKNAAIFPYVRATAVFLCSSDKNKPADAVQGRPRNYPISYSANSVLTDGSVKPDSMANSAASVMLLIHENRQYAESVRGNIAINDGRFLSRSMGGIDEPAVLHYEGTNVAYADGHAAYGKREKLLRDDDLGRWDPNRPPVN